MVPALVAGDGRIGAVRGERRRVLRAEAAQREAFGLREHPGSLSRVARCPGRTARVGLPPGMTAQIGLSCPSSAGSTEEKIVMDRARSRSESLWTNYVKVTETPEFFLLHPSRVSPVPIPKRSFDPAEAREVGAFLASLPNYAAP
ncbi:YcxB family protein [Streptomyces sp. NPDC047108]|uniref:YcxB family protein n=1 Tax=Streptomyces sp. NPDC047108 TaxID=3155025 RepID=UPI0033E3F0B0